MKETIDTSKLTPMMAQWKKCKDEAKDALLFFRLGDFYEAFYDDAKLMSREVGLTLTERQSVPMCGIPYHTSSTYIDRLVAKGYRIAVAEQVEDPKNAKGLVDRKIVRYHSPGTLVSSTLLQEKSHNFFGSLSKEGELYGLSLIDVSTATFLVFECKDERELLNELSRSSPKELLVGLRFKERNNELITTIIETINCKIEVEEDFRFNVEEGKNSLCNHFKIKTLDGFGVRDMSPGIGAAASLISHFRDTLLTSLDHITSIRPCHHSEKMNIDRATLNNLEVIEPLYKDQKGNSLFSTIDCTYTSMGARTLKEWLKAPLLSLNHIEERQDSIEELLNFAKNVLRSSVFFDELLKEVGDLERLSIRIKTGQAGPRDYASLKMSLSKMGPIQGIMRPFTSQRLKTLAREISCFDDIVKLLSIAFVDTPPLKASDGGFIRIGYNKELDDLRALQLDSQKWLLDYQNKLREELDIKTLKVGFNRMFGYYIEVSRGQTDKMPPSFHRRQTLTNGERYISEELKAYEEKILTAEEKSSSLEQELYSEIINIVSRYHEKIVKTAQAIAEIDALRSLSIIAQKQNYVRPKMDNSLTLQIEEGRHPVIEASLTDTFFTPNNISLDGIESTLMLITGPNMAGKSTYIRQVALLVILAQIGSFIPAKSAHIGIVDAVFSRIGASDNLAKGHSTFMVEMVETATILNQATTKSLVILDEIGRGTSTYDGISIAWAVAEHLLRDGNCTKTLFATHYYELTALSDSNSKVKNYTVAIREGENGISFLHKIIQGKTDRSYGIHVAKIAGLPQSVTDRAEDLLKELENKQLKTPKPLNQPQLQEKPKVSSQELTVLTQLKNFDLSNSTPISTFIKLDEWQKVLIK